jgi:hypothetical protein
MAFLFTIGAFLLIAVVLVDAFNTVILVRRTRRPLQFTRVLYRLTWPPFAAVGRRIQSSEAREGFLSIFGPLSLAVILAVWAAGLVLGFGLLQWAAGLQSGKVPPGFANDLYISATTLFTMDSGDPRNTLSKWLTAVEAGLGFSLLGLLLGYLPVLYQAFSRRELQISLLDARAGSPPSTLQLLQVDISNPARIERYMETWERWAAEILENQLSFPMMAWFRSHHANQSWLTALTAVIDCAAVVSLCAEGDLKTQAGFTFAMGRHALVDIAGILDLKPPPASHPLDRLPQAAFPDLRRTLESNAAPLLPDRLSEDELSSLREMYEPYAQALSFFLLMALPRWTSSDDILENWKVPRRKEGIPFAVSDPFRKTWTFSTPHWCGKCCIPADDTFKPETTCGRDRRFHRNRL